MVCGFFGLNVCELERRAMRFAVIFEEGPDMVPVRQSLSDQHLAFLQAHSDEILMAGGLRQAHEGPFVGGMWVFEVASRERAIELIESDPYYMARPRAYRLLAWGQALR
jgi:uncharacterized protein YciI